MELEQINNEHKGYFRVVSEGKEAGRMTYSWAGENRFIIDHTEVNPDFSGQGVGQKMIEATLAYARENDLKVIPLCPFAKAQFDRHKDWHDVLLKKS